MDTGRNRLFGLIILLCSLLPAIGNAESYTAMGAGAGTCAEFAKGYRKSPRDVETLFFTWAQGWMTGVNQLAAGYGKPQRDLDSVTVEKQQAFIRQYCDKHPLANFESGVAELYNSLEKVK